MFTFGVAQQQFLPDRGMRAQRDAQVTPQHMSQPQHVLDGDGFVEAIALVEELDRLGPGFGSHNHPGGVAGYQANQHKYDEGHPKQDRDEDQQALGYVFFDLDHSTLRSTSKYHISPSGLIFR